MFLTDVFPYVKVSIEITFFGGDFMETEEMILLKLFDYAYGRHTWTARDFSSAISKYRNYLSQDTMDYMAKVVRDVPIVPFGGSNDHLPWEEMLESFEEPLKEIFDLMKDKDISLMISFALRADLQKYKYDEKFSDFMKQHINMINDHDIGFVERDLRERKGMFSWYLDKTPEDDAKFEELQNFVCDEIRKRGIEIWN